MVTISGVSRALPDRITQADLLRKAQTSVVRTATSARRRLCVLLDFANLVDQPRRERRSHNAYQCNPGEHEPSDEPALTGDRVAIAVAHSRDGRERPHAASRNVVIVDG